MRRGGSRWPCVVCGKLHSGPHFKRVNVWKDLIVKINEGDIDERP